MTDGREKKEEGRTSEKGEISRVLGETFSEPSVQGDPEHKQKRPV